MEKWVLNLICVLIVCIITLVYTAYLYLINKRIKDLVWFCTQGSILDAIFLAQRESETKYRIFCEADCAHTEKILSAYREYILNKYFSGILRLPKRTPLIPQNDFFMLTLCSFLADNYCESKFAGQDMHSETLSYSRHGSWGCALYEAEYKLSDFGIVVAKLYYISYVACKNSIYINPKGKFYTDEDHLKEIIDNEQIAVCRL